MDNFVRTRTIVLVYSSNLLFLLLLGGLFYEKSPAFDLGFTADTFFQDELPRFDDVDMIDGSSF